MKNTISVVVVNWNAGLMLKDCLNSLVEHGGELISDLIVVDNASTDGSDSDILSSFKSVKLIKNKSNLGFGTACNIGAASSDSDYILFLNPDAAVDTSTLKDCILFMDAPENNRVAVLGVKLLNTNGQIARGSAKLPNPITMLSHSLGLNRIFKKIGYTLEHMPHTESMQVDHVIGAFYFVRRRVFNKISGFDERFFVYLEDLDLSKRIIDLGYSIFYSADINAYHIGGGVSSQIKATRLFYSTRSRLQYSCKHFTKFGAAVVSFSTLFVEPFIRITMCLLKGSLKGAKETITGYKMLYSWLLGLAFKNKQK